MAWRDGGLRRNAGRRVPAGWDKQNASPTQVITTDLVSSASPCFLLRISQGRGRDQDYLVMVCRGADHRHGQNRPFPSHPVSICVYVSIRQREKRCRYRT